MKRLSLGLILALSVAQTARAGSDPFIGEIVVTPASDCPKNFTKASGQSLPISQNQPLYSLLGTTYGGNAQSFNVPNVKPTYDINGKTLLPCIALSGIFPPRP